MAVAKGATVALVTACALAGCEKSQNNKAIVLNPTTRQTPPASRPVIVAATAPASKPSSTQTAAAKPSSRMLINGVWVTFPEAKLLVRKEGDKLNAFLVSNDPPEVINPSYQGNRYYFEMTLDTIDDIKNIAQADFRYKAASAESQETPNGIFLDGDRQHLEPYDIQVTFDRDGDHLIANIQGQFIYFPKGSVTGQWVPVVAQLAAKPETK
ncbi:MAG TPA: hypothetical protein VH475_23335 [Tepidisphaeraceae bacterium]|jgi:hypothetical protein